MAEPIPCRQLVEMLTDYGEQALADREPFLLENHLGNCAPCSTYISQMQLTLRLVSRSSADEISADHLRRMVDLFRRWRQGDV